MREHLKSQVETGTQAQQEKIQEALDNEKLAWLRDKADRFGLLISNSLRNDPVRLESWLRHKAQQRGLNFDSDYKNYIYQWK